MDPTLLQRLITELDNLSTKVWNLAEVVHTSSARIGLLQKIIIIMMAGILGIAWNVFIKK